jgi:hypothetical protein
MPAKNPTPMADIEPNDTASPKNIIPDAATGSLFKAPTILPRRKKALTFSFVNPHSNNNRKVHLYVVLLVVLTHHAVVYEMPTAAAPENAIAKSKKLLVSSGL